MTLEWIRRNFRKFDETLKLYLFTKGDIAAIEELAQRAKRMGELAPYCRGDEGELSILKIEAPDAICVIPAGGATAIKTT